ncbi:pyridoxal phosphate-dependent transferase [Russula brevipes]|nr:pyridoxal phosphate-dependent transferase [Russula brevipes]
MTNDEDSKRLRVIPCPGPMRPVGIRPRPIGTIQRYPAIDDLRDPCVVQVSTRDTGDKRGMMTYFKKTLSNLWSHLNEAGTCQSERTFTPYQHPQIWRIAFNRARLEPDHLSLWPPKRAMSPTPYFNGSLAALKRAWAGIYVTLKDGREIIDAVGGAAVACIGNGHPVVRRAIKEQVDKLAYVYNVQLSNEPAEELARTLIDSGKGAFELCGFFAGGSEAMEGAVKLARQYWYEQNQPQRKNFISRRLSFHGNTVTTLSLSGHPTRRTPYEDILQHENFHKVSPAYAKRFQCMEETEEQYVKRLRQELEDKFLELGPDTVIGFVAETVVGATTGALAAPKGYFKAMKSVCRKYGALFILDEVMSGMGRMGTTHAWESFGDNVPPDIQAVAKGLGGGYASIGAVLMSKQVADGIRGKDGFWKHGHTYMAHPLSCAAAIAVQKVIVEENLLENGRQMGVRLAQLLRGRLQSPGALAQPFVFDVRAGDHSGLSSLTLPGPKARG